MNKFIVIAALAQAITTRPAGSTTAAEFTLAGERHITDHTGKRRNIPFYIRAEALGKAAESIAGRGYQAGDLLAVEGVAEYSEWPKEGQKQSTVRLKVTGSMRKITGLQTTQDAGGNTRALGGLNRVTLIGNLAADVDVRMTEAGDAVANIRLAVNEKYTTRAGEPMEKVHWFNVTLWREQAEAVRGLHKGDSVFIEGSLGEETYTDKEGHERRSKVVEAELAYPVIYTDAKQTTAPRAERSAPPARGRAQAAQDQQPPVDADDLPF